MEIDQKWERLQTLLREMKGAVLAYSGGVDSSLLLKAASEAMGARLVAITAVSETYPGGELKAASAFATSLGVAHRILRTTELEHEAFAQNASDRCYHCKTELFGKLSEIARHESLPFVLDGSNTDDLKDLRPGRKAAESYSVRSPLIEAGFCKADIRQFALSLNLPMWNKPSLACLSSRIPFGTRITRDVLDKIQQAEDLLHGFGFSQVRVRHHGDTARIEIEKTEFALLLSDDMPNVIVSSLKALGYTYVCLDLAGYRTGSMNEAGQQMRNDSSQGGGKKA